MRRPARAFTAPTCWRSSAATRAQPTPARPARLHAHRDATPTPGRESDRGEPGGASTPSRRCHDRSFSTSDHASHDTFLVASLADHSLPASERAAAEALVAACSQCADLHADLLALPGRDPGHAHTGAAERLHAHRTRCPAPSSGGGAASWRSLARRATHSADALAVGLTTLGLAGLLVANIPSFSSPAVRRHRRHRHRWATQRRCQWLANAQCIGGGRSAASGAPVPSAAAAAPALGTLDGSAAGASAAPPAPISPVPPARHRRRISRVRRAARPRARAAHRPGARHPNDLSSPRTWAASRPWSCCRLRSSIGLGLFALRWTTRRWAAEPAGPR